MKLVSSWDDGNKYDIGLAMMLKEHNIPAIFYIPNNHPKFHKEDLLSDGQIKDLKKMGFEIGGHTYRHPDDLKLLSEKDCRDEIFKNKEYLENLLGEKITKFCYPRGRYNDETIKILKEAGYEEARTTMVLNTDKPINPFRTYTSIHVYPNRQEYNGVPWYEVARELYKEAKRKDGYFHIFGHSWEIENFGLWEELDDFLTKISEDSHLWS